MKSRCLLTIVMLVLLCATAYAEPWSVNLEESTQTLPWVFIGELIEVTDSGVTAVISETFIGEHQPGDTLSIPYWEMDSCSDGMYRCKVYPTGLSILDSPSLSRYITRDQIPEEIRIGIEIYGAELSELGLDDEPFFSLGESGNLLLSGADGMFNIPIIHITDYDSRPVAGFDSPASNDNPLYFRFENLPDGPSGHLATDIIDALAKGTVTGSRRMGLCG